MAALTDAMKWYSLGGLKAARLKYFFIVEFFSSQYVEQLGGSTAPGRLIFDSVRTVELPKYSVETEVANAWNVRQIIPTRINFEPISITFTDTIDNRFQSFIKNYMNIISGNFQPLTTSLRTEFDSFGINSLRANADCPLDKIVITRFYGDEGGNMYGGTRDGGTSEGLLNKGITTLWRPKIIDVQHDTLDYSSSDAVTWQVSIRFESMTYDEAIADLPGPQVSEAPVKPAVESTFPDLPAPRQWNWQTGNLEAGNQGSDLPPSA